MSPEDPNRYVPDTDHPVPLFVDTSALFAYFYAGDDRHEDARGFVTSLADGDLPYRRLYTNDYVLDETYSLLARTAGSTYATTCLDEALESSLLQVVFVGRDVFDRTRETLEERGGRERLDGISFTDWVVHVHMAEIGVDHVWAYDDDFAALGDDRVPYGG